MLGLTHHEAIDLASFDKGSGSDRAARDMALSSYLQIRSEWNTCAIKYLFYGMSFFGDTVVYYHYISLP